MPKKETRKANRCRKCGYRIRGPHHEEGYHHKHPKKWLPYGLAEDEGAPQTRSRK